MSHALRAAVAAALLLTCPACATTGLLDQKPAEETGAGVSRSATHTSAPAAAPAGTAWLPGTVVGTPDGTAATLAWEQLRSGVGGPRSSSAMLFEQPGSQLRLVLNMSGSRAGGTTPDAASGAFAGGSVMTAGLGGATLWPTASALLSPEVIGPKQVRTLLGRPDEAGAAEALLQPLTGTRDAPEPATLTLAAAGALGVGLARRLRRAYGERPA
jgi:hypothetical protein